MGGEFILCFLALSDHTDVEDARERYERLLVEIVLLCSLWLDLDWTLGSLKQGSAVGILRRTESCSHTLLGTACRARRLDALCSFWTTTSIKRHRFFIPRLSQKTWSPTRLQPPNLCCPAYCSCFRPLFQLPERFHRQPDIHKPYSAQNLDYPSQPPRFFIISILYLHSNWRACICRVTFTTTTSYTAALSWFGTGTSNSSHLERSIGPSSNGIT